MPVSLAAKRARAWRACLAASHVPYWALSLKLETCCAGASASCVSGGGRGGGGGDGGDGGVGGCGCDGCLCLLLLLGTLCSAAANTCASMAIVEAATRATATGANGQTVTVPRRRRAEARPTFSASAHRTRCRAWASPAGRGATSAWRSRLQAASQARVIAAMGDACRLARHGQGRGRTAMMAQARDHGEGMAGQLRTISCRLLTGSLLALPAL
eukprot:scaffold2348_cov341-Prasinococcus_capsulatus_cf.AAC.2